MAITTRPANDGTLDGDEHVTRDLFCVRCGCNLRGYNVRQPCPTCLHPISDSVWGDFLIYSQPREVKRIEDALALIIYGAVLTAVVTGLALLGMLLTAHSTLHAVQRAFDTLLAGAIIATVVSATGIATLTRRHSWAYFRARYSRPRNLLPVALGGVGLIALLVALSRLLSGCFGSCLLVAAVTVSAAVFFRGAARLMALMPNQKLALHANVMCFVALALGIMAVAVLIGRVEVTSQPRWEGPLPALTFMTAGGAAAFAALAIRLLLLMRRALRAVR